mgnify:CR=1 FL=1|tara:strand:- start:2319 stop:3080 length:762 start_codon:yes stop_codon:yes gene_type:complete
MPKIKSLIWYLNNPKYLGHALRVLKSKLSKVERSRKEAVDWAKNLSISNSEFCKKHEIELRVFKVDKSSRYESSKALADAVNFGMGGAGNIDLIYSIVTQLKPQKILETGVSFGWSSLAILEGFSSLGQRLISTDMPYVGMGNDNAVGVVVPKELKNQWQLIRDEDKRGLPKALELFDGKIDLCHYDSDKSYHGRMFAYPLLYEALNDGCWFVSDDIGDNVAFKDFCKAKGIEPEVIVENGRFVGAFRKNVQI